mmetsp:Transcript_40709/g.68148  ORF Transcript_40709/g.68148 Transcript_40709/m.68148 type:complete len:229 (+) Transcript_40709:554-1240(+)
MVFRWPHLPHLNWSVVDCVVWPRTLSLVAFSRIASLASRLLSLPSSSELSVKSVYGLMSPFKTRLLKSGFRESLKLKLTVRYLALYSFVTPPYLRYIAASIEMPTMLGSAKPSASSPTSLSTSARASPKPTASLSRCGSPVFGLQDGVEGDIKAGSSGLDSSSSVFASFLTGRSPRVSIDSRSFCSFFGSKAAVTVALQDLISPETPVAICAFECFASFFSVFAAPVC